MTGDLNFRTKSNTFVLVMLLFAASLVLGDYGIRFYVSVLQVPAPHHVVAGVTEPLTTKLIPALAVAYFHQNDEYKLSSDYLQSHPYLFSAVGGLSVGVFERALYIIVRGAEVSPVFLVAPVMHFLNAVLIGGIVFATSGTHRGPRVLAQIFALVVVAMVIHVFWNTFGVVLVYQAFQ